MLKFTEEHEWLKLDGDVATVGITEHASVQLGDLVFIELPKVGAKLKKGAPASVVESVKTASDTAGLRYPSPFATALTAASRSLSIESFSK